MEKQSLKINFTKYSGLPLHSLKFLVKTKAPIDKMRKREVWKELFYRYFTQGRDFNLYRILRDEPVAFGNTISWELNTDEVEIPTDHVEDFIRNLLDFIQFVDRQVLASDNLQFEWQLLELAGIQSMIERVRDAKIKDMNTRQKINLFIDKINNARKEALKQIEEAKSAIMSDSVVAGSNPPDNQIVISEERTALMKQELIHLQIAMSKVNKGHWVEMIQNLHTYYPEDQKKIVRHGVKKYPHDVVKYQPLQAFIENRDVRNPEINMIWPLLRALEMSGLTHWYQYLGLSTVEEFLRYVREWYCEAENATEEFYLKLEQKLMRSISEHSAPSLNGNDNFLFQDARKLYNDYLLSELDRHFWLVEENEYGKLSDMLELAPGLYEFRSENEPDPVRVAKLNYSQNGTLQLRMIEPFSKQKMSKLDLYYALLNIFEHKLARNNESTIRRGDKFTISENIPSEYHSKIKRFFQLPLTLDIDSDCGYSLDRPNTKQSSIESVIIYKFIRGGIKTSELRWLYATKEGYEFFKANTTVNRSYGMFHSHEDYVAEFIEEVLPMFDFRIEDQLSRFFSLSFDTKDIYGRYPRIKKEVADRIVRKLLDEIPHELQIVAEFFDGIEEEYSEYEIHEEFEGLSPMELLLLQQQGIEIGKERHYKGYKETNYNEVIHYTPEEARTRFIIDYYKNYYGT